MGKVEYIDKEAINEILEDVMAEEGINVKDFNSLPKEYQDYLCEKSYRLYSTLIESRKKGLQ